MDILLKNKRLKKGTIQTDEQRKIRARFLCKRWAKRNKKKIKAMNKKFSDIYRETKPYHCCCIKCDATFSAPRNGAKLCPNCRNIPTQAAKDREKRELMKRQRENILRLAREGVPQKDIAARYGLRQHSVSAYCIRNGIRRRNKQLKFTW